MSAEGKHNLVVAGIGPVEVTVFSRWQGSRIS